MEPTTFTTIVMIAFAVVVLSIACYAWFGSWQPEPRRARPSGRTEVDHEAAVAELRRAIAEYERGDRTL